MAERAELALEIEPQSDPITGVVEDETGKREFRGWIELMAALEAARLNGSIRNAPSHA